MCNKSLSATIWWDLWTNNLKTNSKPHVTRISTTPLRADCQRRTIRVHFWFLLRRLPVRCSGFCSVLSCHFRRVILKQQWTLLRLYQFSFLIHSSRTPCCYSGGCRTILLLFACLHASLVLLPRTWGSRLPTCTLTLKSKYNTSCYRFV